MADSMLDNNNLVRYIMLLSDIGNRLHYAVALRR